VLRIVEGVEEVEVLVIWKTLHVGDRRTDIGLAIESTPERST
jgi:hypothetical protein